MAEQGDRIADFLDFSGKIALVTGVLDEHSIAWPIAKYLHAGGANVVLSIQRRAIRRLMGNILEQLDDPPVVECDVSKDDAIAGMVERIGHAHDHIDYLVHSIAYAPPTSFERRFVETSREDFSLALDVSAYSLIALSRGLLPLMQDRGGCILGLTYLAAEKVIPGYQLMSVAKAALENIIRNLAFDLAPHRIRVNGLSPGPVSTRAATSIPGFSLMHAHFREYSPLRSEIVNDDVGKTALFLCSPLAEKITGEIVHIDGGYNIMGMTIEPPADRR